MELDVRGLFASKWLKITYKIDEELLENKLQGSEEKLLFRCESLTEFKDENTFSNNLEILKEFHEDTEVTSGGRIDIIMRTHATVLQELSDYRLEYDNLTLLERLIAVLKNIDDYPNIQKYIEPISSLINVSDAIMILKHKK